MCNEGVIKFQLFHTRNPIMLDKDIKQLVFLRQELLRRRLIGVYPADHPFYPNVGYGNVSMRNGEKGFIITGSQTGHIKQITDREFVLVRGWSIEENLVYSVGSLEPSSEALTHAAIYECNKGVEFVAHGHHRNIWRHSRVLGLDSTPSWAEYGSPSLALAIKELCFKNKMPRVVVLKGHEDGILVWGASAEQVLELLDLVLEKLNQKKENN